MIVYAGTSQDGLGRTVALAHRQLHPGTAFVAPFTALAWVDAGGALAATAVFCNYTGPNIDIHLAIKRPSIRIKRDIYRYVFGQLKCSRLTGKVPITNTRLIRLARGLGFHIEGSLPYYYGPTASDEAVVFGLYSTDVRKL